MSKKDIVEALIGVQDEIFKLGEGSKMFIFVYCAGHGIFHKEDQLMILNATSGNLFNIE